MSDWRVTPVILSGGSGTRLWPLSREAYPKQFLPLTGSATMLQATVQRLAGISGMAPPTVVCNARHRFLVAEQLREIDIEAGEILLEPDGRNTAPALALAALSLVERSPETIMLALPADHFIADPEELHASLGPAERAAAQGSLVTFGIVPSAPETGYGYIRAGRERNGVRGVRGFVEKPDETRAREYLAAGDYFWNSGIFMFRADAYLAELEHHAPEILSACRSALASGSRDLDFLRVDTAAYAACPADSIDYAVMEHTERAAMVPLDAGWSDIGSWSSLRQIAPSDASGNVTAGDVWLEDVSDSYVRAESRLVAAVGVTDHVIVETSDAVLVADANRVQEVKRLVSRLDEAGRSEVMEHPRVYRPWGWYETLVDGERFHAKRILVKPGAALSLQMHHHRAEHWVVVKGSARVTRDDDEFLLAEDQSTYIPVGTRHRLENPGKIPLELLEIQTGSYLGEDDIVRFEDRYGR